MQCLNIKNKEVAALLKEYTEIFGNEDAAYYVLSENNGYGLDKAPNGADSKLFSDLLAHYDGDKNKAILAKSKVYTDSFKNWFGDWLSDDKSNAYRVVDFNDSVDFLFEVNPELAKVGTKSEYEQYIKTIFPNSVLNSIYWHGTDSDFSDGLNTAKKGKGSGAPETQNEMYFNRQPWASLQYISGVNRKIADTEGFSNWVKLWWELKEALGNGRMDTEDWKNEIIGPNIRQYSPNKRGIFDRDKGGTHGKYLSERKARYGYENKSDKEFFEEVFDIRYGKETFNDWINRKRNEFKNIWNSREVKKGIIPAVLNIQNPIVEKGQNTYYEEQRGLFTKAKQNNNDAILSNESKNEFGSDVAIVFDPIKNVHFLGTKSDIENFKKWKSNNQVSKVVDENGEPKLMFHGSDYTFDTFRSDVAIYTTDKTSTADSYYYSKSNVDDRMELFEYNNEFENYALEREGAYNRMKYLLDEYADLTPPKDEYDNPYSNSVFFNSSFQYKPYKAADDFLHKMFPDFLNHLDDENYRKRVIKEYVEYEYPKNPTDYFKKFIKGQTLPLYVNNKNPLIIDGKYSPWNKIEYNGKLWSTRTLEIYAKNNGYDGLIIKNIFDLGGKQSQFIEYGAATVVISYDPNQIKSIDNQGTFSTQDNNIYNQQAQSQTGTGRNEELARLLQTLYPKIEVGTLTDPNLRGQAHVEGNMAGKVLLNAVLENQDTLPHEYAHHYIAWFRNAPIVQNGIKQFGSEESLVQAIGENSVKATKWYNRFFNWIKGLFNKKQATLNTLTNNFLKGGDLQYVNNTQYRVYNQTVNEIPNQIHKVYEDIMTGIERRISDFKYSKFSNDQENELRRLQFQMNQFENDKAVFEFVDYMARDVYEALDRVNTLLFKVREDLKYNNPISVSPAELDLIKKGYIGFYGNIATNIQNMLDDQDTFTYINDSKLIEEVKQSLNKTISNYYELVRNYNNVVDIIAKENFIAEASKAGSFTIDELRQKLEEGDKDINLWNQWVGSTQYSDSEIVRLILNKIATAKNKVAEEELIKGKHLTDLLSKVDKSKLSLLHEKNKKGHKTGFMTRDLNYGEHYEMYLAHQRKLADDLGFADKEVSEVPGLLNAEQLKIWNKANNDWDAKYTIRKFTPEYYELTNSLSEDARSRRDEINMEINLLLRPTVDESGDYHREDLSDEDYLKLQELETRRRNLANPFYTDGTVKVGLDKKIADEIRAYNKKLRDKLHYEPNMEKFNKARKKAKENLSAEKYAKWVQRNTVEQIVEEFWEDVKKLSSVQVKSEDQILYEEARRNLLRLYMREDGTIDVDSMPDQAKDLINTYDSMIYQERMMNKEEGVKSRVMEIAEWEINPKYYAEFEKAENAGEAAFNAWAALNTTVDGKGNIVPASFWKRLVPKKELRSKYTRRVPNRSWSEIDKESPFYDKRFTKYVGRGETRIPNPKYFDNSSNYNKIISDKNLKALYDALVDTYAEANSEISFMRYSNNYKLAQIEGGAWTQIMAKDNILKGLGYAIADSWTVKDDDNMYMLENAKRSDGSLVKLVPTRYIKMLSDPNTLTNDIVGSTIAYYKMAKNYKEMSEIAPELEIALDFVSRMNFTNSKGGRIEGIESKTYDKLKDTINRLVYGMERDAAEFDIKLPFSDKQFRVSLDKFVSNVAAYTRIQGISQNLNVILTGLITNKIQNRLEAMSGIYFSNKELAQATKILMPSYVYALNNIGKSNNKDKVLCYLEYLGIVRENSQTFSKLNQSRLLRALNQHFWYFGHEMTDYITKGKLAIAIGLYYKYDPELNKFVNKHEFLRRFKNKKEGKAKWNTLTTTFFDAFEVENNVLVPKKKYQKALDEVTINKVRNTAKQVGTRIDTQITDLDKSKLHSTIIGQLLLIYRNFILVNLQTKFLTKRQFNYSTGLWSEAQWPAAINAIKTIYNHYYNPDKINQLRELYKDHYDELTEYEKGCLKRVTYEVLFSTLGFFIISSILRSMADDDKRNWWKQESAYLALRASLETRGNILPIEVINMLNTPTAAWTTLQGLFDMCASIMEDGSEEVVRGPYKGMTRFERSLIKITPLRSIWEARDPRSKMEYYDNMISIFNF